MLIILLNIAIGLELLILYCMYTFTQNMKSIPWCQFDGSYVDRMIDKIENKTQT